MPQKPYTEQHCVARALYDNQPDSRDELAFEKGDILIVLEQNPDNIEGWWLCSLRGKQGICPANRLRLIPGYYSDSLCPSRISSPHFNEHSDPFSPAGGKKISRENHSNQVVTPKRFNDIFSYDIPPSRCSPTAPSSAPSPGMSPHPVPNETYDVPPPAVPIPSTDSLRHYPRYSPAPSSCVSPLSRDSGEAYDIPRSLHPTSQQLTPSSSASSLTADSLSSSNRSSVANVPDYDVPKPHGRAVHPSAPHYDISAAQLKELPLELGSALENLERLQTEATSAITKLQSFVGPRWRSREKLENNLMEIRLSVTRLGTALHDLAEFGEGTLGNATRASDKNLATKLAPMVSAIIKSSLIIQDVLEKLNRLNWDVDVLTRPDEEQKSGRRADELEQLVACSRTLTEDIRQIASFIQGNGLLLFKSSEPNQGQLNNNNNNNEYGDDDYVSLESKENVSRSHADILNELPKKLKKGFSACLRHAEEVAFDGDLKPINSDDKLLLFYAHQLIKHHNNLTLAIDAFLQTVEHNQPPKIFLAHGKFVVLSAHKLVLIGDTVHRNVNCRDVKERALTCANALSDALANSVNKTKQAALQFPSVNAVQEMVDSIVDISHAAKDLKVCLVQAANPL